MKSASRRACSMEIKQLDVDVRPIRQLGRSCMFPEGFVVLEPD